MTRKRLIAANWKMNYGVEESLKYWAEFTRQPLEYENVDIVLCPPFTSLYTMSVAISENEKVYLGAQNCFYEDSGAYTGEVSPVFLQEISCDYVIVGHSERRQIFKEDNQMIAKKLVKVFEHDMLPIFCVGETLEEREKSQTFSVIEAQLKDGLVGINRDQIAQVVIAYEPVWAIGTGKTATPEQAQEVHQYIREHIRKHYGSSFANEIRILYGGSAKPENIRNLISQDDIDGALVGGASLHPDQFLDMVRQCNMVK